MISRRSVLLGLGAALAAPAVVSANDDRLKRVQQELKDAAALRSAPQTIRSADACGPKLTFQWSRAADSDAWFALEQRQVIRYQREFLPIARSTPVVHT